MTSQETQIHIPIYRDNELSVIETYLPPIRDNILTLAKRLGAYTERSFHQGTFIPSQQLRDGDEVRLR